MTEDTLNGYEQDALIDWYESDWPTTSAAVATLYAAVERIVAARTAALARDRGALAAKLTRAIDMLPELTEGPLRAGTSLWPECDRDAYSLAIEEAQSALRAALAGPEDTARDTQRDGDA